MVTMGKSYRLIKNGILEEYDLATADSPEFWQNHWGTQGLDLTLNKAEKGYLGGSTFILPDISLKDNILEAGCGKGQNVVALIARGYKIRGIDFAETIIDEIKRLRPDIDVITGNLKNLPFENKQFTVYLSFGVIEHFNNTADVDLILNEALRVTSGRIFISVPYLSPALKKKYLKGKLKTNIQGNYFYQYYFSEDAIKGLLLSHRLSPYKTLFYATHIGLKRNNGLYKLLLKLYVTRYLLRKSFRFLDYMFGKKYAHMVGIWSYVIGGGKVS